jgi:WD40 repeat protein
VHAVDISPDATKIATGSTDKTACVWSLSTGERLLDPFKHDDWVVAVKFSPDGQLIATATWGRDSVRVYDSQNGHLLVEFLNQSLAWANSSK